MKHLSLTLALVPFLVIPLAAQGGRGSAVQRDRDAMADSDLWIYNDLDKGFAQAKEHGQPLLVVFR